MAIEFGCPSCGRAIVIEDEMAGLKIRCPQCAGAVEVPRPVPDAAAGDADPAAARRCPFCRETVHPQARKCPHCHEFLDRDLAIVKAKEEEERIKRRVALEEQESRLAKVSLVCGFIGLVCPLGMAGGPVAILLSIAAHRQIRENPRLKGIAMARSGLVLGIIGVLMWPALLAFLFLHRQAP